MNQKIEKLQRKSVEPKIDTLIRTEYFDKIDKPLANFTIVFILLKSN